MLIPLHELIAKYNINLSGVLHIGAHECEELKAYETHLARNKILWIEALPEKVQICKEKFKDILIENAVVSDKIENVTFNRANNGQSSSFLTLGLHAKFYPNIIYTNSFEVETKIVDNILTSYPEIPFNFINLDIQGAELKALRGMSNLLQNGNITYIYTEVNSNFVYKDCCIINEIDSYLQQFGFKRMETRWTNCEWGDAFYIKA